MPFLQIYHKVNHLLYLIISQIRIAFLFFVLALDVAKKDTAKSFTKNIVVYADEEVLQNDGQEEKKSSDMLVTKGVDEKMAVDIIDDDHKPTLPKRKSRDDDDEGVKTRVSVKDVFNIKKNKDKDHVSKQPGLEKINESGDRDTKKKKKDKGLIPRKLKKDKSVFDAFKKEKKPDLSNIKSLPISLKTHLNDDSSDHVIQLILDHIRVKYKKSLK